MDLSEIIDRAIPPAPWAEGDNIPWNEPSFSERMLAEHLNQEHDLASRRLERIDAQIDWMQQTVLPDPPAHVLDLACGPGLYLGRLAQRGHSGVGFDFSPASIAYAQSTAGDWNLDYREDDLRSADFGSGYDVALLLYGQINVFRRDEASSIVLKIHDSLRPGGVIVVEPQSFDHVRSAATASPSWTSSRGGLFSEGSHVTLTESFWNDETRTSTQRFYVVDAETGTVSRYALSNEAYTDADMQTLLADAGFTAIQHWPSLTGDEQDDGLSVVIGEVAG
jgi:SAM-dependent methyltransferase